MTSYFALDLGTTKFCLAMCQNERKVDLCQLPAGGIKKGMLADFAAAKWVLMELLETAEKKFSTRIKSVAVGITGNHLRYYRAEASIKINGEKIAVGTLNSLQERVKSEKPDREILHVIPLRYRIDAREWLRKPLGFRGQQLEAEFFVIDSDRFYLEDVMSLCNDSGLEVSKFVAESIASSGVTLTETEKEMGVALIDIGGGSSDGIVFIDGIPQHSFSIATAGNLITQDLSYGLHISKQDAELVKQHFGLMTSDLMKPLSLYDLSQSKKQINWRDVYPVLAPRIDEFVGLLEEELAPFHRMLRAGVALTGGGAQLPELASYIKSYLHLNAFKIVPKISMDIGDSFNLKYATVLGLLHSCVVGAQPHAESSTYLRAFINWLRELSH
ncbi:MAG: cell division protein FtsA [Pseudomonadota bacterium]|nr:cell division protein FtsA [Pseudomonadota bacterium]